METSIESTLKSIELDNVFNENTRNKSTTKF